ncbi:MAG: TIGR02281 family clan AA aspartic protease [Rickettsiaceae bacterium]|nr:MAG: TIGR02281 family clan AA aspartic protease [Rickettsiaceae bacterium]
MSFHKSLTNIFTKNFVNENLSIISILIVLITLIIIYQYCKRYKRYSFLNDLLIWFNICWLIIISHVFKEDLYQIYKKTMAALLPSHTLVIKEGNIMIGRNADGHFYTDALVNGVLVKFMIDTGASDVALTAKDAQKIGIDVTKLKYDKVYLTANGKNLAAPFKIKFKIADLTLSSIEAHIGMGELDISLLGMSVIRHFKTFNISNNTLTIAY